jgi:hypothetical protein
MHGSLPCSGPFSTRVLIVQFVLFWLFYSDLYEGECAGCKTKMAGAIFCVYYTGIISCPVPLLESYVSTE